MYKAILGIAPPSQGYKVVHSPASLIWYLKGSAVL